MSADAEPGGRAEDREPAGDDRGGAEGGADLVREALDRARADGAARRAALAASDRAGQSAAARGRRAGARESRRRPAGDPATLGAAISALVEARGWQQAAAASGVITSWADIVGPEIGEHTSATALADGVLTVQADSTSWATQLRLLSPQLLTAIERAAGPGVVTKLSIKAPTAPSWVKGKRRVAGRGPRDTYG